MSRKILAVFLVSIFLLSGCISSDDVSSSDGEEAKTTEDDNTDVMQNITLIVSDFTEVAIVGKIVSLEVGVQGVDSEWDYEVILDYPGDIAPHSSDIILAKKIFVTVVPEEVGSHSVKIVVNDGELKNEILFPFEVIAPQENAAVVNLDSVIEIDSMESFILDGSFTHSYPESCIIIADEFTITIENSAFSLSHEGIEQPSDFEIKIECGKWTKTTTTHVVKVGLSMETEDPDGDGIRGQLDSCPNGFGETEEWSSDGETDYDSDGCRDTDEDWDDDADGIIDPDDKCLKSTIGWLSTFDSDYDSDGCEDATEDDDDDNDGIEDELDSCPKGKITWSSTTYTDYDSDGCQDLDEDSDDDNDSIEDVFDNCWRGVRDWLSNSTNDFDSDGCNDEIEDSDDDNDGVYDTNETGVVLDLCPFTQKNRSVDSNGCADYQKDSDEDGVNDEIDLCHGTPNGIVVNADGCADLDEDGVFENADMCADTPDRWTIDSDGCAIVQLPIAWSSSGHGYGRMDKISQFTFPTLDGTWSFRDTWSGEDVYLFLFKYTDGNGNSNSVTWAQNPGNLIRKLPANTQLFYGSFDSSYHSDVIGMKTEVERMLSTSEEQYWMPRIHFIDQRGFDINGGLGDVIDSWSSLYYGIDRFQRARETGSLYAWTTQSNDVTHMAYEPHTWNSEFKAEIRENDPAVEVVEVMNFASHQGGWGSGHHSYYNTTFDLIKPLEEYDTLEVFHEHACSERRNRYQKSDSTYGGCHEWDYLAYLRICERNDTNSCGTEMMRWITTYGREGRWLTDISPYMFMIADNETRRFKYSGANGGSLTVKFLFSDWGSGLRSVSGERVFTGGQFDGDYNNESRYKRQHNFSTLGYYDSLKIVATITGHGFNQDQANCAEFCDHEHHYYIGSSHTYEWHPIVHDSEGCEKEVKNGVVANQFGSWPFGRAGWCAGQDVKQWSYDITDWVDNQTVNELRYRGLFNGQEYNPQNTNGGSREIRAEIWLIYYESMGNA